MEKPFQLCPYRVYSLKDPREKDSLKSIRYVGATKHNLIARLASIISQAKGKSKAPYLAWVRELLALGLKPQIYEVRAVATSTRAKEALRIALRSYEAAGCPLLLPSSE